MTSPSIAATEFKAQCLKLLDEVQSSREALTITKHGRPVARLVPIEAPATAGLFGSMRGSVTQAGDLVSPVATSWAADR